MSMIIGTLVTGLIQKGLTSLADALVGSVTDVATDSIDMASDAATKKVQEVIKDVTGVEVKSPEDINDDLLNKIADNKEKFYDLLVERNRHEEAEARLELERLQVKTKAVDEARDDTIRALESEKGLAKWFGVMTIVMVPIIFFTSGFMYYIILTTDTIDPVKAASSENLLEIIIISVINFIIGSSVGSKLKESSIAKQVQQPTKKVSDFDTDDLF